MSQRTAMQVTLWLLIAAVACGGDRSAGPSTPASSSALASQVVLAVGGCTSIRPRVRP